MSDLEEKNLNFSSPTSDGDPMSDELEKTSPETIGELGKFGSESNPELATKNDTFKDAQEMGLYPDATDDLPVPVGSTNLD